MGWIGLVASAKGSNAKCHPRPQPMAPPKDCKKTTSAVLMGQSCRLLRTRRIEAFSLSSLAGVAELGTGFLHGPPDGRDEGHALRASGPSHTSGLPGRTSNAGHGYQ